MFMCTVDLVLNGRFSWYKDTDISYEKMCTEDLKKS